LSTLSTVYNICYTTKQYNDERKLRGVDISPYLIVEPPTDHTQGKKVHELIHGMIVSTMFEGKYLKARTELQDDGSMSVIYLTDNRKVKLKLKPNQKFYHEECLGLIGKKI
jgi:hypothetical protein